MEMDRNLALELVRVTEAAALSCARWMGRGDAKGADQAAVDAMRRAFDGVHVRGTVVIGEGERDEAPMLYIGEQVGARLARRHDESAPQVDIAVDPLEGTNLCATGAPDAHRRHRRRRRRQVLERARHVHGQDRRRAGGQGRDRHHQVADVEPAGARRGQAAPRSKISPRSSSIGRATRR